MDRHFTTAVFVVYQNKTLLHLHKKHNLWLPVGGHVDPNESPAEAAIRETKEESGLDVELYQRGGSIIQNMERVRSLIPPMHMQNERIADGHEHIDCIFYARANTFDLRPEEGTVRIDWFTEEELANLELTEDVLAYAKEAFAMLK